MQAASRATSDEKNTGMEIAPGVHSIGQDKGGQVRCFLLDDGRALTLIDTLWDIDGHRILDQIKRLGRTATDLKHIVLTHAHRSHLGGLAALKRISRALVCCHPWEADIVQGERSAQPVPILPMRPLRIYYRVYYLQLGAALGLGRHPPCPVDRALDDGDQIGPIQVVHTPGHTPGHLAFYWAERRTVFAGDAVVTYPVLSAGWPAFVLNRTQACASLGRMEQFEPEVIAVGHGDAITEDATERLHTLTQEAYQQWISGELRGPEATPAESRRDRQ